MYQNSEAHKKNLAKAREILSLKTETCSFCSKSFTRANISKHENSCKSNPKNQKPCPVCDKLFSSNSTTCSYSCANTYFKSGNNHPNWIEDSNYRKICFNHHEKICVICGEENIVAVHHIDENHSNNDPSNLVPLCPTHHQYVHSSFKYLVEEKIANYIQNWKLKTSSDA